MKRRNLSLAILGATLAASLLAACSKPAPPPEPPRSMRTMVIRAGDAVAEGSFSGEVRARHETPLGFRIGGKLQRRLVDVGAVVKKGQALALLDAADAALQAAQAEAQRAEAEAELKRYRDLRTKNFISQSALDARETAFKAAQAQAGLARNVETYTTLRADADGVIAATLAEPGQVVAAGTPVLVLAHAGEREVAISLPESAVARYKVGDAAEVRLWADEGKAYRGKVREIAPAADPVTRTYPARITLLDADADAATALGMSARVVFASRQRDSVTIPAAAILQQGDVPAIWLVADDGTVSLRNVSVQAWRDDRAVIADGLKPGERIVERGVHKLHAGEKIVFDKQSK